MSFVGYYDSNVANTIGYDIWKTQFGKEVRCTEVFLLKDDRPQEQYVGKSGPFVVTDHVRYVNTHAILHYK